MQHLFVRVTNVTDDEKARATLDKLYNEALGPESGMSNAVKLAIAPVWISREELRSRFGPTFTEQLFSLPVGDWSDPINSTSGWHKVRVLEHQPEKVRDFEEVQAEVENDLRTKLRLEVYNKELELLAKKYNVTIIP